MNWLIHFLLGVAFVWPCCQLTIAGKRSQDGCILAEHHILTEKQNTYIDCNCAWLSFLCKIQFFPVHVAAFSESQPKMSPRRHSARCLPLAALWTEPPQTIGWDKDVMLSHCRWNRGCTDVNFTSASQDLAGSWSHYIHLGTQCSQPGSLFSYWTEKENAPEGKAQHKPTLEAPNSPSQEPSLTRPTWG